MLRQERLARMAQKAAVELIDGGFPVNRSLLRHSQRFQRRLIDCCCFCQAVGALVIRNSGARLRPKQTIYFPRIITLFLQCGLDICDHLIGRQIIIAVYRTVIGVVSVGSVAPSRDPVSRVPGVPSAIYKNYAVVVMAPPPALVVPRRSVIPEGPVIPTLPVLAASDAPALLEIDSCEFCRTRVRRQIETLCLVFFIRLKRGGRSRVTFPLLCLLGIGCRVRVSISLGILCGDLLGTLLGLLHVRARLIILSVRPLLRLFCFLRRISTSLRILCRDLLGTLFHRLYIGSRLINLIIDALPSFCLLI